MQEYKMPCRDENSHKGTFGKILNFAGSKNYIGAAYLSTVAALKIGAGFIALATDKDIIRAVSTMLPEAVYLSSKEGLKHLQEFSVILIGCGLGNNIGLFKSVIQKAYSKPIVIDADGLNILSKLKIQLPSQTIITPHPLEAARLLNSTPEMVLSDTQTAAKRLAEKYHCIAVLKTHRTVICDGEKIFINQHGNSALAKAGSGDVLAGIIAGLLAQKVDLFEAAKLGVYIHSRAGELASEIFSEYSVLASELPDFIPNAVKELN